MPVDPLYRYSTSQHHDKRPFSREIATIVAGNDSIESTKI